MAVNTLKNVPREKAEDIKPKGKGRSIFSLIETYIRLGGVFEQGLPVRYIPYILFLTTIGIFYIANRNFAEKTAVKLNKLKTEIDDLRTLYITEQAEYMIGSKQSEVAKKVKDLGLNESETPPYKIIVDEKK